MARRACFFAGGAYLLFGAVPVALGLAAALLAPDEHRAILPVLADLLVHPLVSVLFVLALVSAVLSTIDSAILAPAGVIAENLFRSSDRRERGRLLGDEAAVLGVALASLAVAFLGETAYSLLESAYEVGLVSLLVPLVMGLWFRRGGETAALASMGVGTVLWLAHLSLGWEWFGQPWLYADAGLVLPVGLSCAACGLVAYLLASRSGAAASVPQRRQGGASRLGSGS